MVVVVRTSLPFVPLLAECRESSGPVEAQTAVALRVEDAFQHPTRKT